LTARAKAGFVAVGVIEQVAIIRVINDVGIAGGGCFVVLDRGKLFGEVLFGVQFGEGVGVENNFVLLPYDEIGYGVFAHCLLTVFTFCGKEERVASFAAGEGVVPRAAVEGVRAPTAVEGVVAVLTEKLVFAAASDEDVAPLFAGEGVVASSAFEGIVAIATLEAVVFLVADFNDASIVIHYFDSGAIFFSSQGCGIRWGS